MLKVPYAQLGEAVHMRAGSDKGHAVCGASCLHRTSSANLYSHVQC